MAVGFRDHAISYTIGLDATEPRGLKETASPLRILSSDRNILFDKAGGRCSSGLTGTRAIRVRGRSDQNAPAAAAWTNAIHGLLGNVLALDGSVARATTKELDAQCDLSDDNGNIHFLVPK